MSGSDLFSRPRRRRRGAALTLVFAGVLAAGFATDSWSEPDRTRVDQHPEPATPAKPPAAPDGDTTEPGKVADAAARALADGKSPSKAAEDVVSRSGDRWGSIYDPSEYEAFERELDGEYNGVGLWTRRAPDGQVKVVRVQRDSPAARAGIAVGDQLRSVDDKPLTGRGAEEIVSLLRGDGADAGTRVKLGLRRDARAWSLTLRRATLETESVAVRRLADGPVLIKITALTKGAGAQVRDALRDAPPGAGVLLDLRGNAGGLVTEAQQAASVFLDGGLVATYDVRGKQRALHAEPGGSATRALVVLVDGGTMSAAELLAGALQDRGRAVVVGSRTFGKGSVQMPSRLPDGSVAELTVGHYRTPSGRTVDGRGITPDLEVDEDAEQRARTVLSGLGPPS
ncbi:S41 family peptidase [Streptomyces apocyni]|uniref:S41 family peptidase n=1 Tax=Streptomyces apocyni TaxID=2654677 RepID=UPI0012E9A600|nr:S41 family peptidase [Streptomyces apocyni]